MLHGNTVMSDMGQGLGHCGFWGRAAVDDSQTLRVPPSAMVGGTMSGEQITRRGVGDVC